MYLPLHANAAIVRLTVARPLTGPSTSVGNIVSPPLMSAALTARSPHADMMAGGASGQTTYQSATVSDPSLLYLNMPTGGSYADILGYFVTRNVPTYQFSDQSRDFACVALAWALLDLIVIAPVYYLYLSASAASQSEYYEYRYLLNSNSAFGSPPASGVYSGATGDLVLVGPTTATRPTDCWLTGLVPSPPATQSAAYWNSSLLEVSTGSIPLFTAQ